jgi:glycosyltransferase involved in cell wall biosynthesis
LPEYGGPAFSVSRLAVALGDAGVEVGVWAADQSAVATPLLSFSSPVQRIVGTEAEALGRSDHIDILHDNGIWLRHNHRLAILAKRRGIPRVVSTRGMLEPWALRHKRFKKYVAWRLYQRRDLRIALYHHTTAEAEAQNLQHLSLAVPISIVPNGIDMPGESPAAFSSRDQRTTTETGRTALFLGRIYPIKGLPMLIQAWSSVRPKGWQLCIAGPDEAGHRKDVENAVLATGLTDSVSFLGPIAPQMKAALFSEVDLLILPSYSESFGMVVAEALAHGLPVLTTKGTPWSSLPKNGCGWWVEPTVDGICSALHAATNLDRGTLRSMGANGRALVAKHFAWRNVASRFICLYESVLTSSCRETKFEDFRIVPSVEAS